MTLSHQAHINMNRNMFISIVVNCCGVLWTQATSQNDFLKTIYLYSLDGVSNMIANVKAYRYGILGSGQLSRFVILLPIMT